jgi:nicotinamide-nucleotide amidase
MDPTPDPTPDATLHRLAARLGATLTRHGLTLAVAESCTGGWIAKCLTDVPGSSAWFERGLVTYSNAAKQSLLGVDPDTLRREGAVSKAVAAQMARGVLAHSPARVALAVTGIAGPEGGVPGKPVGTVWLAWALPADRTLVRREQFSGDREAVRRQTVATALATLLELLDDNLAPP